MQYQLRQKLLAFGDDFTIKDADGVDRYFVDGRAFSIGDKASFQDMQGNELLRIEQKVLSIGKTFHLERDGQRLATVKKKPFTMFRDVFDVEDARVAQIACNPGAEGMGGDVPAMNALPLPRLAVRPRVRAIRAACGSAAC